MICYVVIVSCFVFGVVRLFIGYVLFVSCCVCVVCCWLGAVCHVLQATCLSAMWYAAFVAECVLFGCRYFCWCYVLFVVCVIDC